MKPDPKFSADGMYNAPKKTGRLFSVLPHLIFPLVLFYWEILFAFGVHGRPASAGIASTLLFSLSAGAAVQVLTSLFLSLIHI